MNTIEFIKSMAVLEGILKNSLSLRVIDGEVEHDVIAPSDSDEQLVRDLFALANVEMAKVGFSAIELIQDQRTNLLFNTNPTLSINWSKTGHSHTLTISPRACIALSLRIEKVEYVFNYNDKGFNKQTSFVVLYK